MQKRSSRKAKGAAAAAVGTALAAALYGLAPGAANAAPPDAYPDAVSLIGSSAACKAPAGQYCLAVVNYTVIKARSFRSDLNGGQCLRNSTPQEHHQIGPSSSADHYPDSFVARRVAENDKGFLKPYLDDACTKPADLGINRFGKPVQLSHMNRIQGRYIITEVVEDHVAFPHKS